MGLTIAQMGLGPLARQAATVLLSDFGPETIEFRRGYRDLRTQAHDMAANVRRNKDWIKQTYTRTDRPSFAVACRLQDAVYLHGGMSDAGAIEQYLYAALLAMPNAHEISFHVKTLNGQPAAEAFDMTPLEDAAGSLTEIGAKVEARILTLPNLDAFLKREGGLRVWHLQFRQKSVEA